MAKQDSGLSWLQIIFIILAFIGIVILWLATGGTALYFAKAKLGDDAGVFGDFFGVVNSLFSGFAFAGIIITIFMQHKELGLQRDELASTRKEFETQNKTLKLQRFENTFFSMLELHHNIVSEIVFTFPCSKKEDFGRYVFKRGYEDMYDKMKNNPAGHEKIYLEGYNKYEADFGHYFVNLYRMFKMVDQVKPEDYFEKPTKDAVDEFKYKYTSIIRAQLSNYEKLWLFYNCLSVNGIEKFKPLVERYSLLKNMPQSFLVSADHKKLYDKGDPFGEKREENKKR